MKDGMIHPQVICFGEVLWDTLPEGPQPGGAPMNMAYHLAGLGVRSAVISRIGNDQHGKQLKEFMDKRGINTCFLQVDPKYPTSKVIARVTPDNEVSYEIVFPVAWDFIGPDQTEATARETQYFVYGSLASRNEVSRNTLITLLQSTTAIKVFDVNLRPPFTERKVLEVLLNNADIVKFNLAELGVISAAFEGPENGDEAGKARYIMDRFPATEVIVTKGASGAALYTPYDNYHSGGIKVTVSDTVGSGDAFLATFVAGHLRGHPPAKILKDAVAMGAFITTKKGACPGYDYQDYDRFKKNM